MATLNVEASLFSYGNLRLRLSVNEANDATDLHAVAVFHHKGRPPEYHGAIRMFLQSAAEIAAFKALADALAAQDVVEECGMSSHTPGPWKAVRSGENGWQIDAEYHAVATDAFCYASEKEANARLIAAAPDLFDYLGALCNKAQDFIDGECNFGSVEEFIAECREVLAKVEAAP